MTGELITSRAFIFISLVVSSLERVRWVSHRSTSRWMRVSIFRRHPIALPF